MPSKRKIRRPRSTRRRRTVRRKMPALSLIRRFPQSGLPESVIMKHKYADSFSFASGATPHTQFFRLNSMYDPDQSGVGHQPYYYDQMTPLYNRCIVYGCHVKLKATCGTNQAIVGFKDQIDTSAISTAVDACERPNAKYALLNNGAKGAYLSKYFPINKLFGVTKSMVLNGEMDFSHDASGNPLRQWYLQIFAQNPDSSTATNIQYTIELIYYTKWIDRKRQNQS